MEGPSYQYLVEACCSFGSSEACSALVQSSLKDSVAVADVDVEGDAVAAGDLAGSEWALYYRLNMVYCIHPGAKRRL